MDTTIRPVTMAEVKNRHEPQTIGMLPDFASPNDFVRHIGGRIYGYLAETAGPIIEHYHSDLFHDALKIQSLMMEWRRNKPIQFLWSVNESGTDWRDIDADRQVGVRENAFVCTIWIEEKNYGEVVYFRMERVF